ncbi:GOLPH3/VPS74 family protein [Streptomyces acidicola]|uniref:GPP34 family phosphoprotein n=1 Tax=Streptomyces acidicola TaxID=2596892 RepID=A0A5N8WVC3_9ACTN|nr:GPP34 family phosphoprotein [Streptomyces acidicola]MPY51363.1 GPP34 family phosphoprotein [Streptomyces acidicola]
MPNGSLSLPARLYLLAWDTTRTELTGESRLHHLVRAGALTELAQRGLLTDEDGIATPVDPDARTGDLVLDGLLELVEESRPRTWQTWVTLRARVTLDAVRAQLAADGCLRVVRRRALGFFPTVEYELERVSQVDAQQEEARRILEGPLPVAQVPERDAALVALAASAGLRTLSTGTDSGSAGKDPDRRRERIEALTERGGAAAPALRKVVQEMRTALLTAAAAVT